MPVDVHLLPPSGSLLGSWEETGLGKGFHQPRYTIPLTKRQAGGGGRNKPVSKNGSVAFVEEESTSVVLFSISVCLRDFITKTV